MNYEDEEEEEGEDEKGEESEEANNCNLIEQAIEVTSSYLLRLRIPCCCQCPQRQPREREERLSFEIGRSTQPVGLREEVAQKLADMP